MPTDAEKIMRELTEKRRRRSIALGLCLGAFALLFFSITIFKLGPEVLVRDGFSEQLRHD